MQLSTLPAIVLAVLGVCGALRTAAACAPRPQQDEGVRAVHGEWLYVEDRTESRPVEQHQPSTSTMLRLRVEDDAVVLIRSDGEIRMALDGSPTEVEKEGRHSRYRGKWSEGAYTYEIDLLRGEEKTPSGMLRFELRPTDEGLLARVEVDPPTGMRSLALYRHPQDIAMPTPAKATIGDVAWLAGDWVGKSGTNGTRSIEERWSPPLGGAMLAVSRTVSRERMVGFEFLRIVERDGGLVYVAQPSGRPPTEFVLTEVSSSRAVFENPRHDSPQRIVYELSADGRLTASVGFAKGGNPRRFEFAREAH